MSKTPLFVFYSDTPETYDIFSFLDLLCSQEEKPARIVLPEPSGADPLRLQDRLFALWKEHGVDVVFEAFSSFSAYIQAALTHGTEDGVFFVPLKGSFIACDAVHRLNAFCAAAGEDVLLTATAFSDGVFDFRLFSGITIREDLRFPACAVIFVPQSLLFSTQAPDSGAFLREILSFEKAPLHLDYIAFCSSESGVLFMQQVVEKSAPPVVEPVAEASKPHFRVFLGKYLSFRYLALYLFALFLTAGAAAALSSYFSLPFCVMRIVFGVLFGTVLLLILLVLYKLVKRGVCRK